MFILSTKALCTVFARSCTMGCQEKVRPKLKEQKRVVSAAKHPHFEGDKANCYVDQTFGISAEIRRPFTSSLCGLGRTRTIRAITLTLSQRCIKGSATKHLLLPQECSRLYISTYFLIVWMKCIWRYWFLFECIRSDSLKSSYPAELNYMRVFLSAHEV